MEENTANTMTYNLALRLETINQQQTDLIKRVEILEWNRAYTYHDNEQEKSMETRFNILQMEFNKLAEYIKNIRNRERSKKGELWIVENLCTYHSTTLFRKLI